jgi:CheY-like chemotaxis protein
MDRIPVNVLLVSRDLETVSVLTRSMPLAAMEVEVCSEVRSATRRLCHSKFEGVVVDLKAETQAAELLGSVHGMTSHRSTVVIAIVDSNDDTLNAFRAGANFILERPFLPGVLTSTLKASYSLMLQERRRYFRCSVTIAVSLTSASGAMQVASTINISENGMALSVGAPLAVGERFQLGLDFSGTGESARMTADVCWADDKDRVGVEFVEIPSVVRERLRTWLFERLRQSSAASADC